MVKVMLMMSSSTKVQGGAHDGAPDGRQWLAQMPVVPRVGEGFRFSVSDPISYEVVEVTHAIEGAMPLDTSSPESELDRTTPIDMPVVYHTAVVVLRPRGQG